MRVSVDEDDPGYAPLLRGCKVFYEGYERKKVFTADEEKRLAVVALLDDHGNSVIDRQKQEVMRETIYGHIRIECDPVRLAEHIRWLRPESRASAVVAHYGRLHEELK